MSLFGFFETFWCNIFDGFYIIFVSEDKCLTFAELPPLNDYINKRCPEIYEQLSGTSSKIYKEKVVAKEEDENADGGIFDVC